MSQLFGTSTDKDSSTEENPSDGEEEEWETKFQEHPMLVLSGVALPAKVRMADPPWAYPLSKIKGSSVSNASLIKLLKWMSNQQCPMVALCLRSNLD